MRERQNKFKKALETIEKRDLIQKVNRVNAAMLMKKLFSDIPKIRAKIFLNKLKNIQINKSKYEKLKKHIKNYWRNWAVYGRMGKERGSNLSFELTNT